MWRGMRWRPNGTDRNAYLRIDVEIGEAIRSIRFDNLRSTAVAGYRGDFLGFDHVGALVPKPSTAALLALGLGGLAATRRHPWRS